MFIIRQEFCNLGHPRGNDRQVHDMQGCTSFATRNFSNDYSVRKDSKLLKKSEFTSHLIVKNLTFFYLRIYGVSIGLRTSSS